MTWALQRKFPWRRMRGKSKVYLKRNSATKRKTARHSQGKRETSPMGVSQHHSQGANWLSAKDSLGTWSPPAWTGDGPRWPVPHHIPMSADGCHPEALWNADEAVPGWSWKENLGLSQGGAEQVVMSCKSCDSVTKHDKGGEKQSMTSAGMEITSATAWGCLLSYHLITLCLAGQKDTPPFLYNFTLLPSSSLLFPSFPFSLIFFSPLSFFLPSFGHFPSHILPFFPPLNASLWLSPL